MKIGFWNSNCLQTMSIEIGDVNTYVTDSNHEDLTQIGHLDINSLSESVNKVYKKNSSLETLKKTLFVFFILSCFTLLISYINYSLFYNIVWDYDTDSYRYVSYFHYLGQRPAAICIFVATIMLFLALIITPKAITLQLNYVFKNKESEKLWKELCEKIDTISLKKYYIADTTYSSNVKNNYNARISIDLQRAKILKRSKTVVTNIDVIVFKSHGEKLILLPDSCISLLNNGKTKLCYDNKFIQVSFAKFGHIVSGNVPEDTTIVRYNWQHANRDGSPDRRFAENNQLPVCLFGELDIATIDETLTFAFSDSDKSGQFADTLKKYISLGRKNENK